MHYPEPVNDSAHASALRLQPIFWRSTYHSERSLAEELTMIEVFIEITGKHGQRTFIEGGPFETRQVAYAALHSYAVLNYGGYLEMMGAIDAYGFIIAGPGGQAATERRATKP
jgi:hypothetical protein